MQSDRYRVSVSAVNGGFTVAISEIAMRAVIDGADLCSGGEAIASGQWAGGFEPAKAFDDTASTYWMSSFGTSAWIRYYFTAPVEVVEYTIQAPTSGDLSSTPKNWTLDAWNGSTWVVLDQRTNETGWTANEIRTYGVDIGSSSTSPSASPSPTAAPDEFALEQQKAGSGNGSSLVLTFDAPPSAGALLVVAIHINGTATIQSVTDSADNEYLSATNYITGVHQSGVQIWYSYNIVPDNPHAVTITLSTSSIHSVNVSEWSGVGADDPLDPSTNGNERSGVAITSFPLGVVCPARDNSLLVATCGVATSVNVYTPSGFVALSSNRAANSIAYQIQTTATQVTPTFTCDSTAAGIAGVVAIFRPALSLGLQQADPVADVAKGTWVNESANQTNLYLSIDDGDANIDTDYIETPSTPTNDTYKCTLGDTIIAPEPGDVSIIIRGMFVDP